MQVTSKVFAKEDNSGNFLYLRVFYDEFGKEVSATIFLKLKSEQGHRRLGDYRYYDKSFHILRESGKHYHYKSSSYGFNWTIINDAELDIQTIHLVVDKIEKYVFPKTLVEKFGKFLNFKSQGFELQRFLSFKIIKDYAKKEEHEIENQNAVEKDWRAI